VSTNISTPSDLAKVKCPKRTGKMDKDTSCQKCEHYDKCYLAVFKALRWRE
jgi:hypothetical protein